MLRPNAPQSAKNPIAENSLKAKPVSGWRGESSTPTENLLLTGFAPGVCNAILWLVFEGKSPVCMGSEQAASQVLIRERGFV